MVHWQSSDFQIAEKLECHNPIRYTDNGDILAIAVVLREGIRSAVWNQEGFAADITQLPPSMWGVADSVSCLHALEHFGLGRYGDPIMPDGYVQGLRALWSLLAPGGVLYLSVPMGRQRIEFNAHRVFALQTILDLIAGLFDVSNFSYIDDGGRLHENTSLCDEGQVSASFGLEYGCAIFELSRK